MGACLSCIAGNMTAWYHNGQNFLTLGRITEPTTGRHASGNHAPPIEMEQRRQRRARPIDPDGLSGDAPDGAPFYGERELTAYAPNFCPYKRSVPSVGRSEGC